MCEKCQGTALRPLTEDELNAPGVGITFSPIYGPDGWVGTHTRHCECDIGRVGLRRFKDAWYAAFLGCGEEDNPNG